jgi:serine/threonine protein kinase
LYSFSASRFVQEARAASALNHRNIVTVHDAGEEAGLAFLVMEYLSGKTLEAKLREGRLPLGELIEYAVQATAAVGAAHAIGIVHRDLKPSNLMLTTVTTGAPAQVKVLDFGLAKLKRAVEPTDDETTKTAVTGTKIGTILGTAPYMSPEQARPVSDKPHIGSCRERSARTRQSEIFEISSPLQLRANYHFQLPITVVLSSFQQYSQAGKFRKASFEDEKVRSFASLRFVRCYWIGMVTGAAGIQAIIN